jgi:drug/metabolite transporter (DMT)-like permease
MVALNWGEQHVDAGTAAMVINISPMLIALAAGWILHEGLSPRLFLGMVVSFVGTVVVGLALSQSAPRGSSAVLGVALCVVAAVSYTVGVIGQKPALRHGSALQITTFGCLVGTLACAPFAPTLVHDIAAAPLGATLNVIYLGVFPTAIAFTAWAYALARTTAGKMGATTYVVPALVVLMAWLVLDEVPTPLAVAGGVLCLAGVAVSRSRPRKRLARR